MQDLVLARKYRPKTLDEVIGQPVITRTLSNALKSKKLHHAYLFSGTVGTGKTTTARILAAMENCDVSPGLHPCGKCEHCKDIFNGTHTDISELDGAGSLGSVEQARKLKADAQYNALTAGVKYYIIDECLPAESSVTMSDGSKMPIGEMVEAALLNEPETQSVRSRDMETGEVIEQDICRYIKIPNDKQMYEIEIKDESGDIHTVRITGNHAVFTAEGKVKTQDLEVGQKVFLEKSK